MNVPHVEPLPVDFNGCIKAAFEMIIKESTYMTRTKILKQLQNVCIVYACLAVKRIDGVIGERAKQKDAATGFQEVVVPGFLKWASLNGVSLPPWLTREMFGKSTMGGGERDRMTLNVLFLPLLCDRLSTSTRAGTAAIWCLYLRAVASCMRGGVQGTSARCSSAGNRQKTCRPATICPP